MPPNVSPGSKDEVERRKGGEISLGGLDDHIGYVLRRAQLAVFQDFIGSLAEFDIRPAQYSVLTVIEATPGLKQSQVSSALGIQRTNFVTLFDELERRGLARRMPVDNDRRSYALYLTETGAALMEKLRAAVHAHEARLDERLGRDGRGRLMDLLKRLADLGGLDGEGRFGTP